MLPASKAFAYTSKDHRNEREKRELILKEFEKNITKVESIECNTGLILADHDVRTMLSMHNLEKLTSFTTCNTPVTIITLTLMVSLSRIAS